MKHLCFTSKAGRRVAAVETAAQETGGEFRYLVMIWSGFGGSLI